MCSRLRVFFFAQRVDCNWCMEFRKHFLSRHVRAKRVFLRKVDFDLFVAKTKKDYGKAYSLKDRNAKELLQNMNRELTLYSFRILYFV